MKVRLQIPGFYGVLTQHFDNPNIIYLPSYTSIHFKTNETVFVTRYPDIDKNSIIPLRVQFHEYPVASVHVDNLQYMDADIDGDCIAVWKGDINWKVDDVKPKEFQPIKTLSFNEIKQKTKKIPEEMLMDLLNCKINFDIYIKDINYRFNILDKVPMLSGTLFKRYALLYYGLFVYDLKDNIRFVLEPQWKYTPSKEFIKTTENYDIWIRTLQIICNKLNSICLKFKHPTNTIDDLRKVLTFLKISGINIDWFEKELGIVHDTRYTTIEEFAFWFTEKIEKNTFEIFKAGIKTRND